LDFRGSTSVPCSTLAGNGFQVGSSTDTNYYLQFICKDNPCVVTADHFWYGSSSSLIGDFYFNPTAPSSSAYASAMTISWTNRPRTTESKDVYSILVRWGRGSVYAPTLSISSFPEAFDWYEQLSVSGRVEHANSEPCYVFAVHNDDFSAIQPVGGTLFTGGFSSANLHYNFPAYGEHGGHLDLYVITESGRIGEDFVRFYLTYDPEFYSYRASRTLPSPTPADGVPLGLVIGISVGGVVVLAALITACVCCCVRAGKKEPVKNAKPTAAATLPPNQQPSPQGGHSGYSQQAYPQAYPQGFQPGYQQGPLQGYPQGTAQGYTPGSPGYGPPPQGYLPGPALGYGPPQGYASAPQQAAQRDLPPQAAPPSEPADEGFCVDAFILGPPEPV
jgi:hypothetical protein